MNLLSSIKNIFAGPGQLPSVPFLRPPNRPVALQSWKTGVAKQTSAILRPDRRLANTDITTYRQGADTRLVIRDYAAASPDLAATKSSYLRVGIPESYTIKARDMDGTLNVEATKLAQEILRRVTFLGDPTLGYNPVTDLQSLSESLAAELVLYGSMGLELALDKMRMPLFLQAVSTTKIQFKEEDNGVYPIQVIGGAEVSLDIPTFFYASLDQDLLNAYSSSYFEAAIQSVLADAQFLNDLRKSMQRVIQPRLTAKILEEKINKSIDPTILNDPEKLGAFYNEIISAVTNTLSGLNPEDALVHFDSIEYKMMGTDGQSAGNIASTMDAVQKLIESKLAAGAKTMPAVLGRDSQASGAATSTMLFLKNADVVRRKLNNMYSRMLTQAVRLMAQDCYVEFRYEDLNLRPQDELEAFKAMKQSRILEQLSLGFITDEDACIDLTGNLPREGHVPLAGTMFKSGTAGAIVNPLSTTSTMGGGAPDKVAADTPKQTKGNPNA